MGVSGQENNLGKFEKCRRSRSGKFQRREELGAGKVVRAGVRLCWSPVQGWGDSLIPVGLRLPVNGGDDGGRGNNGGGGGDGGQDRRLSLLPLLHFVLEIPYLELKGI